MNLKLNPIASNMTELNVNGIIILFSYKTPVAAHVPGKGFMKTEQHYSKTTTKHVNKWLDGANAKAVPQAEINALAGAGA